MVNEIEEILDPQEKIIWRGKPQYMAYILRVLPVCGFGLFWCLFLVPFYWAFIHGKFPIFMIVVLGPHTLVGISLLGAPLWTSLMYPYVEYAVTDKRIILKGGFFARSFQTIDYQYLTDVSVNVGLIGQLTNTGDINFVSGMGMFVPKTGKQAIAAIENPYEVFKQLKQVYFDVKTDIEYPNKLRPMTNPGYQTEYNPK